ncbi:hypothetical protein B5F33_04220 [Collinsella sp. An2]|nr:hypothetical protein B5F33_04220 [Collinsella sp. An2]
MFYSYAELEDGAQIARSNVLDDGVVEVSIERPSELGFDTVHCTLQAFEWSGVRALLMMARCTSMRLFIATCHSFCG